MRGKVLTLMTLSLKDRQREFFNAGCASYLQSRYYTQVVDAPDYMNLEQAFHQIEHFGPDALIWVTSGFQRIGPKKRFYQRLQGYDIGGIIVVDHSQEGTINVVPGDELIGVYDLVVKKGKNLTEILGKAVSDVLTRREAN